MIHSNTKYANVKRLFSSVQFNIFEFLASKNSLFYQLLMNWRKPIYLNEIRMADITDEDTVLYIGCGIFPTAPILLAQYTNAKIVTIDINQTVLKHAKKNIVKHGLGDKITIEYGDGASYNLSQVSVIYIAANVWPIDKILYHIAEAGESNIRILCKSMNEDVLPILSQPFLKKYFRILKRHRNPRSYSFLLEKVV